ncbi:MAG: cupin domain-containing protein [Hyphomicrobiaceae bacterium]|nr:cupin domain-containing protein [Hyphomicrobiaceae bacterium]
MPSQRPQAKGTRMIDNARTIVTEYRFAPGAETGWHKHGHDYVVVPMTTGNLLIEGPGGTSTLAPLTAGIPYARTEGVEHNVVNPNATEFVFIEIEMK